MCSRNIGCKLVIANHHHTPLAATGAGWHSEQTLETNETFSVTAPYRTIPVCLLGGAQVTRWAGGRKCSTVTAISSKGQGATYGGLSFDGTCGGGGGALKWSEPESEHRQPGACRACQPCPASLALPCPPDKNKTRQDPSQAIRGCGRKVYFGTSPLRLRVGHKQCHNNNTNRFRGNTLLTAERAERNVLQY